MRRFSTSSTPAAVVRRARWSPAALFQQPPIEDIVELKTIKSVQRLVEQIPSNPAPQTLLGNKGSNDAQSFATWLQQYKSAKQWTTTSQVDKDAFETLVRDCVAFVQAAEDAAWQGAPPTIAVLDDDSAPLDATYIEAIKLMLAKVKCASAASYFTDLDKDHDGKVTVDEAQQLLEALASGSTDAWLEHQFKLFDADSDGAVTETESQRILNAMIETQKTVVAEIFALHVANLPKKHDKLLRKSMAEANWTTKLPEKVRCVFHFADKQEAVGNATTTNNQLLAYDAFKASQEAELEELDRVVAVYTKGFYDERVVFYERKRERRETRIKGLLLATALACLDYVATVI